MSEPGSSSVADFRKRFTSSFFWKQVGDCCSLRYVAKWHTAPSHMLIGLLREDMENSVVICPGWTEHFYIQQVMNFVRSHVYPFRSQHPETQEQKETS